MIGVVLAAALAAASPAPAADRSAIQHAVARAHGGTVAIDRIVVHGTYALASGHTAAAPSRDGLHFLRGSWRVMCSFGSAVPTPAQLRRACGFPTAVAVEISSDESAATSAQRGNFAPAVIAQTHAFQAAIGPDKEQERARLQLLQRLNEQMRTGQITRAQAIRQWSQFRYSWALP